MVKASRPDKTIRPPKQDRKPKVFSENLGIDHLVQLSNEIAAKQESKLQDRVDKAKDKRAWVKERNIRRNGGGGGGGGNGGTRQGVNNKGTRNEQSRESDGQQSSTKKPLTKSSIRAGLVAAQREKAKMRKDARKAVKRASNQSLPKEKSKNGSIQSENDDSSGQTKQIKKPSKKVSFAA